MFHFELFLTEALLKRLAWVGVKIGKRLASAYIQPLANTTLTFSVEFFLGGKVLWPPARASPSVLVLFSSVSSSRSGEIGIPSLASWNMAGKSLGMEHGRELEKTKIEWGIACIFRMYTMYNYRGSIFHNFPLLCLTAVTAASEFLVVWWYSRPVLAKSADIWGCGLECWDARASVARPSAGLSRVTRVTPDTLSLLRGACAAHPDFNKTSHSPTALIAGINSTCPKTLFAMSGEAEDVVCEDVWFRIFVLDVWSRIPILIAFLLCLPLLCLTAVIPQKLASDLGCTRTMRSGTPVITKASSS